MNELLEEKIKKILEAIGLSLIDLGQLNNESEANVIDYTECIDDNGRVSYIPCNKIKHKKKSILKNFYDNNTCLYTKDEISYLNIKVNVQESPDAKVLANYILGLIEEYQNIARAINVNLEEPKIKINIQSPGYIKFLGKKLNILLLAIAFVGICGGTFEYKFFDIALSMKTDGLIKNIVDAYFKLRESEECKQLKILQDKLNIEKPNDNKIK